MSGLASENGNSRSCRCDQQRGQDSTAHGSSFCERCKDKPIEVVQSSFEAGPGRLPEMFAEVLLRDRLGLPVTRNIPL